ncbi:uncharacterized protein [Parasteatoda tepidariorum]|uniref:uncharacterized protein isoform X2 n=1 Tax=Parasteatoda tepidariorum TaxID=114398 RepID=UPI001C727BB5|nr:uncharacterized protein LOC107445305 [Parasteatoda tepidariorum]
MAQRPMAPPPYGAYEQPPAAYIGQPDYWAQRNTFNPIVQQPVGGYYPSQPPLQPGSINEEGVEKKHDSYSEPTLTEWCPCITACTNECLLGLKICTCYTCVFLCCCLAPLFLPCMLSVVVCLDPFFRYLM